MEYGSRLRFALIALGGIVLLVLSIWGITSLARRVIGNDSNKTSSTVKKTDLADYNKGSSYVRLTISGPVVASEKYQSYQIEVGQNYREIKIFTGYDKKVLSEQRYSNDKVAYENFLKSIKRSNFTIKTDTYGPDEKGYCATGNRYVYELFDQGKSLQRTWNVSCNAGIGTFAGSGTTVRSLFKNQIPNLSDLVRTTKLKI